MSRLTPDGTAEPVSRDQIQARTGTGEYSSSSSADHEQDWQPYPVDPYSAICDDHSYIHTYIYAGAPIATRISFFVPSVCLERSLSPNIFCTISAFSLYRE